MYSLARKKGIQKIIVIDSNQNMHTRKFKLNTRKFKQTTYFTENWLIVVESSFEAGKMQEPP